MHVCAQRHTHGQENVVKGLFLNPEKLANYNKLLSRCLKTSFNSFAVAIMDSHTVSEIFLTSQGKNGCYSSHFLMCVYAVGQLEESMTEL